MQTTILKIDNTMIELVDYELGCGKIKVHTSEMGDFSRKLFGQLQKRLRKMING